MYMFVLQNMLYRDYLVAGNYFASIWFSKPFNYCLFPISVNSEVSNEVEVTPGVLIRALRAAPVGQCYIYQLS